MIWIDSLIQGILLGGLYALFAAGLSLVFGIMRLVNLAHGDLIVFSAYITLAFVSLLGLHPFVAAIVAAPVMFGIGWLLQRLVLNRVLGPDILPPLLVTFGLSIVLQNALLETWSADSRRLSVGALETASLSLGPISVGFLPVMTFVTAIFVIVVLNQISFKRNWDVRFAPLRTIPSLRSLWVYARIRFLHRHGACHGDRRDCRAVPGHSRKL